MDNIHKLLFKKGDGSVIDSYAQWGIVCVKVPFKVGGKTKKLPNREWYDEHGDDTYIPDALMMEAYDAEFEMAYKGEELASNPFDLDLAFQNINAFKKWLSGNNTNSGSGAELKIYSPYSTIGRQGCYLLEISDFTISAAFLNCSALASELPPNLTTFFMFPPTSAARLHAADTPPFFW